jgi:hypothetical protein
MRGVKRAVTPKVKNGVLWLDFNYKPQWQERKLLKSVGFRWAPTKMMWWCKNTTEARQVASKFNLTEFIAKPNPSEQDFVDWENKLTKTDWHRFLAEADDIYKAEPDKDKADAFKIFDEFLHDKFIKQWA